MSVAARAELVCKVQTYVLTEIGVALATGAAIEAAQSANWTKRGFALAQAREIKPAAVRLAAGSPVAPGELRVRIEPQSGQQAGVTPPHWGNPLESAIGEAQEYLGRQWAHVSESSREGISRFLEERVFPDPEFHRDPHGYMARWLKDRGDFEDFRMPQDPAQDFLRSLQESGRLEKFATKLGQARTPAPAAAKLWSSEWPEHARMSALEDVRYYLSSHWGHLDEATRGSIARFLEERVLTDPAFQRDPQGYLARWTEHRGDFATPFTPHDQAEAFLKRLQKGSYLDEFVDTVRRSSMKAPEGVSPLSREWSRQTHSTAVDAILPAPSRVAYERMVPGDRAVFLVGVKNVPSPEALKDLGRQLESHGVRLGLSVHSNSPAHPFSVLTIDADRSSVASLLESPLVGRIERIEMAKMSRDGIMARPVERPAAVAMPAAPPPSFDKAAFAEIDGMRTLEDPSVKELLERALMRDPAFRQAFTGRFGAIERQGDFVVHASNPAAARKLGEIADALLAYENMGRKAHEIVAESFTRPL